MVMETQDLRRIAANLESMNSRRIQFNQSCGSVLENMLLDVFAKLQPEPRDYEERRRLVDMFNDMAIDVFGDENGVPSVEAFGSFIMNLFAAASDLDLSINFSNDAIDFPRAKKISILRKFAKLLYTHQKKGKVTGVLPIVSARVPVLKVVDCETGIECDISVENKDGVSRSRFFKVVSLIDERFHILSYLMKAWARKHDINSAKDKTMNSLTIISLVAFHLQTRNPPILPPFSALLEDGMDVASIEQRALQFKEFSKRNQESVVELFVTLFTKLSSIQNLWQEGLCASIYKGSWISKIWKSKIGKMSVEDFSDQSQNIARSVGKGGIQRINKCIQDSHDHLMCFMKGQFEASKLKELLFGSFDVIAEKNKIRQKGKKKPHKKRPLHSVALDDISTMSITEGATKGSIKRARHDTHERGQAIAISRKGTTENATKGAKKRARRDTNLGRQAPAYHYAPTMSFRSSGYSLQSQSISGQASVYHYTPTMSFCPSVSSLQSQSSSGQAPAYHYTPMKSFRPSVSFQSQSSSGHAPANHYTPMKSFRPSVSFQSHSSSWQAPDNHYPMKSFRLESFQSQSSSGQAHSTYYHYIPMMPFSPTASSLQSQSGHGLHALRPCIPVRLPSASNYNPNSFHHVYGSSQLPLAYQLHHTSDFMPAAHQTHIKHDYHNQYDKNHMIKGRSISHQYHNHYDHNRMIQGWL